MKLIEQSHEIISITPDLLETIEKAGRTCYKSEDKITKDSAKKFNSTLVKAGHHAMIEFGDIIVRFITNRGVTHELVRHRLCSFAQESTRYVKYDGDMEFIKPVWLSDELLGFHQIDKIDPLLIPTYPEYIFIKSLCFSEKDYQILLLNGWQPQQAREVLPNALKTEIVVKANVREWRHIFSLRHSPKAHPQINDLMIPLHQELQTLYPILF